ncbi:MAG: amidohydrolase family protein [Thermanaerothrix sp.]|uniref:amidohydrolase family protein n=1 Tax=Thermanaerothrix sp. TaxID=2972675 RepID=UPI003C7C9682
MLLENYRPRPKLVTKVTPVLYPRHPVIDAHNHLAEPFGGGWDKKPLSQLLDILDEAGVRIYVDLDGGWGENILTTHLNLFKARAPERFRVFGGVDWSKWSELGNRFPDWAANRLRVQKEWGADGLKIWKLFGLQVRDHKGNLVKVDDPRLDILWETAADLKLPVLIHIADPVAFFDPVDETNERWEELHQHPDWVFTSPPYPPFTEILEAFYRLVKAHPRTLFIGAHVGCYAENLAWVSKMLDDCPNYYIDIAARIGELGRQPYSARRFFIQYQDRILFGSDLGPDLEAYRIYYRFLETDDEYFNYNPGDVPLQGRWFIYGLYLPAEVLAKVYYQNAQEVLGIQTLP